MKIKILLFLMLSVLFVQAQTTPKKTTEHKGYKMAITNASARFISAPILKDDEIFLIESELGKEKFKEILQSGYSNKYPNCFENLLVNNDVKALENFTMYAIENFKIRKEYYTILEIPYDENKNVANCKLAKTVYVIIKSTAIKTIDEYAWLDNPSLQADIARGDSINKRKSDNVVNSKKNNTKIDLQNVLENESVKLKTNLEKNTTDDIKKKKIQQIFSDYYKTLDIVKQKVAASKAFDYEKDKDKYCQFYQGLKIAYDEWDKAYDKLSTEVKDNDNLSKYLSGKEYSDAIGVEMQHYLDNSEYYPILSAFKTNCTSLKEQMDELNTQTKLLDRYNKSIELKEIVLELGELKPYFAAKENMKNVGKNPASTPTEICASILNMKKEMDAIEPKFNKINTLYKEIGAYPRYEDVATGKDDIETTKKVMVMIKFREEYFLPNVEKVNALIIKYGCK